MKISISTLGNTALPDVPLLLVDFPLSLSLFRIPRSLYLSSPHSSPLEMLFPPRRLRRILLCLACEILYRRGAGFHGIVRLPCATGFSSVLLIFVNAEFVDCEVF